MRPIGRLVDVDHLVELLEPLDGVVLAGHLARAVQLAGDGAVERLDEEGRLAAARDAGHRGEQAERDVDGDVLEVVGARALDREPAAARRLAPLLGRGDLPEAGEILPGEAVGVGHHLVGRAFGHHLAAMHAGARPHVDHVVGGEDRLLVMLDHEHGVAHVAQRLERVEQPRIVALMQPDRRLVQHIEHAGQARADLRGEADALALAARQRAGGAGEREIVEADIVEEGEPLADLLQDARGDLVLLGRELRRQRLEPRSRLPDRHLGDLADMQAGDLHRQRLRLQAIALARLAELVRLVARQLLGHPRRFRLAPAPLDIVDHALERLGGRVVAHAVVIGESDLVLARAVQHHVAEILRQRLPRLGHGLAIGARQRFQRLLVIGRGRARCAPTARWRRARG